MPGREAVSDRNNPRKLIGCIGSREMSALRDDRASITILRTSYYPRPDQTKDQLPHRLRDRTKTDYYELDPSKARGAEEAKGINSKDTSSYVYKLEVCRDQFQRTRPRTNFLTDFGIELKSTITNRIPESLRRQGGKNEGTRGYELRAFTVII